MDTSRRRFCVVGASIGIAGLAAGVNKSLAAEENERGETEEVSPAEDFERKEHQLFGEDGFQGVVGRVADIEKTLGIYNLAQFTPRL